jgi:hypothetical protein
MVAPSPQTNAVEAAIVASAHLTAYEQVVAAHHAVQRLGMLSSGRWRSAARDLQRLEDDLHTAMSDVTHAVAVHADKLGVDEDALWAAGDAAATLDLLRGAALELLEADGPAARLLSGELELVFGLAVMEDPEEADHGQTLVFSWADPLAPAAWRWQASWISSGASEEDEPTADELDLYDAGELEVSEPLLAGTADALQLDRTEAATAVRSAAAAFTRASLLLANGLADELEQDGL